MISQTEFLLLKKIQEEKLHPEKKRQIAEFEDAQAEKEIHMQVEAWLKRNEILYIHSRMDRKPTIREGWPDFTAMKNSHVACVEIKTWKGKLSPEQCQIIAWLEASGTPVLVCHSLLEAQRFFRKVLFP